jgi:hypothetical protein
VDDELDDVMASSSNAVPRTTRESPTLATTMRSPCLTMDSVEQPLYTASKRWLVVHSGTCGHVGLFLEVELAVAKFLLVVDERPQHECLLLMVFVRGFQVRNMDSCLALVYKNDSQVRSMKKILRRINITHAKKIKLKTLFKQKKLHARLLFKYYSIHPKI